jgi:RHS repeat-associated protein
MTLVKSILSTLAALAILALNAWCQNPPSGLPVNQAQIPIPLGSIDPLTGNVHLEIPIVSIPQRGDDPMILRLGFNTTYTSYIPGVGWRSSGGGGGGLFGAARTAFLSSTTVSGPCPDPAYPNGATYTTNSYVATDSSGTQHAFPPQLYVYQVVCSDNSGNHDPNVGSPNSITASDMDGLGYELFVNNWTDSDVYDIDGYLVASSHNLNYPEDLNGNYYSELGPLADMLGRMTITFPGNAYAFGCPPHNTVNIRASDGSTQIWTAYCQTYSLSENGYPPTSINAISKIVLPDGSTYLFNYDSGTSGNHYGGLTSVTLPSGGQETFTYSCTTFLYGPPCDLTSATFEGGTWNLSWARNTQGYYVGPTTVIGPSRYDLAANQYENDKTVYRYAFPNSDLQSPAIASIQSYRGSSTLVKTLSWTYKTAPSALVDTITTTLNDTAQSAKVQYQYLSGLRNRPTQIQQWDWGSSTPTRTTKYTYGAGNRITSESVWSGDGTTGQALTQTTYTYDEYSANYCKNGVPMLTNVTGAKGHDDTNFGINYTARLNVTSIARWVSGNTWLTSHRCYDTLGNVTQEVDEAGNPTTYDYSENWADSACIPSGTLTRAYPTTMTDALGNRRKVSAYTCTQLTHTIADENDIEAGRIGITYTYDLLNRDLSVVDQLGVVTNWLYTPTTAESILSFNNNASSVDVLTTSDGYGRTVLSQTRQAPASPNFDTIQTTYDSDNRVSTVSMPCSATAGFGCPPTPVTTTNYDALGRTTQTTDGAGGYTANTYSGNDVYVTDGPAPSGENLKRKQLQYDSLGRVTSVCEITQGTSSWPAGSCGQTVGAIGYLTSYAYNVADRITGVTMNNQSATRQGRAYYYDGLQRLTAEVTPEAGDTRYTYDTDGTCGTSSGDLVKRVDAAGNVACYGYDSVHRLTAKTYPSGPYLASTPSKYFVYDSAKVNGVAMGNVKGRLAEAYTIGNLVYNPDFASSSTWLLPSGWSIAGGEEYASSAAEAYSVNESPGAGQWKPIQPGQTVNLSAFIYRVGGTGILDWSGTFVDANHNLISSFGCQVGTSGSTGSGLWKLVQGSVTAPANTAYFDVFTEAHGCADTDKTQTSGYFSHVWASITGQKTTDVGFNYTARGELADSYEYVSSSLGTTQYAGYYHVTSTYWEDGLIKSFGGTAFPTFTYGPDGEGRLYTVSASAGWNPVTGTTYNPASQATKVAFGYANNNTPGDYDTFSYDSAGRLTVSQVKAASQTYTSTLSWNPNGSLQQQAISDPFVAADSQTCNYTTDDLSRIASVSCGSTWSQSFTYDPFGNITKSGSISWMPGYDSSTNHYALGGTSYDASGNVLNDTINTYNWDADNKFLDPNGRPLTYDALNRLVYIWGDAQVAHGPTGQQLYLLTNATPGFAPAFIPLPGGTRARYSGPWNAAGLNWIDHTDWLGSTRLSIQTNSIVYTDIAFAPFGEDYIDQLTTRFMNFTGIESLIVQSGDKTLYPFLARTYNPEQGRWLSPDPSGLDASDPINPQSWNRYAYVLNNPLAHIDPDGLDCVYLNDAGSGVDSIDHSSTQGECWGHGGNWAPGYVGGNNWVQTDPNSDNIRISSSINGFLLDTKAGYLPGGARFSQDASIVEPESGALNLFAQGVATQLLQNFTGSKAFQDCKSNVRNRPSFKNNAFLNAFSVARINPHDLSLKHPLRTPFVRSTAEALTVKGSALTLGYGGGTVLKMVGTDVAAGGEFEAAGLSLIRAGAAVQVGAKVAGEFLGAAGTIATVGATGFDLSYPSFACYGKLD